MTNTDYEKAFGAVDITTAAMAEARQNWLGLYYNTEATKNSDPCQRIAYTVVQKLVRSVFAEYRADCESEFYKGVLASLDSVRSAAVQQALIAGECCIKPVPRKDGFDFMPVPRQNLLVFGRDPAGNLTDVGTVEKSTVGKWNYTLLERRKAENGQLIIQNRLYRSKDDRLGEQVALDVHPLYRDLPGQFAYPVDGVGLVRLCTPMLSCVDGSREGVSVYAAAAELIRRIDENEAQLRGEFQRGESRIITSRDLLDGADQLTEHLFIGLDEDPERVGFHIFAPQLREQSFLARKQEYLRNVESVVGLQRGMLSEVNLQQRTATEISASGGEFNLTVMDFQRMWERALTECLALCETLGRLYGITSEKAPQVQLQWGNGVLFD